MTGRRAEALPLDMSMSMSIHYRSGDHSSISFIQPPPQISHRLVHEQGTNLDDFPIRT